VKSYVLSLSWRRDNADVKLQVSSRIREDLLARAGEFNIKLEDVSITHLTFGQEFTTVSVFEFYMQGII
jgi:regulator of protease activity HflC (stomatin/prohibitin superfamily)